MGFADFRRHPSSQICTHQFGGFLHNNFVDCFLIFSPYLSNLFNYIQERSNYITEFSIEEFLDHRILIIFFVHKIAGFIEYRDCIIGSGMQLHSGADHFGNVTKLCMFES